MHALKSGMSVRAYAERVGRPHKSVDNEARAARVAAACADIGTLSHFAFSEIHAAPSFLWPALVEAAAIHRLTPGRASSHRERGA
jgi:hypothetical protein